jgi:two-component system sensor histidine kinase/response regulator
VGLTSEVGAGSTFWFTIVGEVAEAAAGDESGGYPALRERSALIVDDNAANRDIITEQLRKAGMHVSAAASAEEALTLLRTREGKPVDLVVLDMKLPGMTGVELARRIKDDPELAPTRLALLTSLADHGQAESAAAAGIELHLYKPVRERDVLRNLDALMGGARESQREPKHREAALMGLRILLAEDNPINGDIATTLLESLGCRVTRAFDGQHALDIWRSGTFDLVLMDCQMPEMDGFTATGHIRQLEAASGRYVPIIALTANALQGDRERCIAAGMDDYLPKPFEQHEFIAKLLRWQKRGEPPGESGPAAFMSRSRPIAVQEPAASAGVMASGGVMAPAGVMSSGGVMASGGAAAPSDAQLPAVDPAVIAALLAIDPEDGGAMVRKLCAMFEAGTPRLIDDILEGLASGAADKVRHAAHKLKASAGTLGAHRLSASAEEIETAARAGHLGPAASAGRRIRTEFAEASQGLAELSGAPTAAGPR